MGLEWKLAKTTDMPYLKSAQKRGTRIIQLIHTNICGPIQTPSICKKTYFLTFIDDSTIFTIILCRKKKKVLANPDEYIAMLNNKFGKKLEVLRSDNRGECKNNKIENYSI